jgi:O-antigen/teichoic acid export membrane protein
MKFALLKLSQLWGGASYISVMAVAAGISFIRGLFVAAILDVPSFGMYATFIAAGMFSSMLLSFGENEQTIKNFPRLWASNFLRVEIKKRADFSCRIMSFRASFFLLSLLFCLFIDSLKSIAQIGILIVLLALSAALSSLYVSAIRATGDLKLLSRNTLARSLIVILFGVIGAVFLNWKGAIAGEIFGSIISILYTRHHVIKQAKHHANVNKPFVEHYSKKILPDGGFWIFIASLFVALPVYLDRTVIASIFGHSEVGTYSFLMLFVAGVNVFVGIIAQKVGPHIIKMEHLGNPLSAQIKYALKWLMVILVVIFLGMTLATVIILFGPGRYFFDKFNLNLELIFATLALSMLQIAMVADFIMISRNRERELFISACAYLMILSILVFFIFWRNITLVNLIWFLALAKLFHITIQAIFIYNLMSFQKHSYKKTIRKS